jgi:hypothetical protein
MFRNGRNVTAVIALIVLSVTSTVLVSCGDNSSDASQENRPLTVDEAGVLAQVLYNNYELGGADFVVTSLTEPGGPQVQLQGIIDWRNHIGQAFVKASLPDAQLSEVYWQTSFAAERRPALDQILMGQGSSPEPFLVRAPNMNLRLDQMLAVVTGLAIQQPENAQLILQNPSTEFVRSLYWVAIDSGRLLRFEGNNEQGTLPIIVDLPVAGPRTVDFPTEDHFIAQGDLGELGSVITTW